MKKTLRECLSQIGAAVESFDWTDRVSYGDWLAQTYFYVRHSTRLLASAAARFDFSEHGDALHHRFGVHISEEKKHELLALHDIKAIGLTFEQFPERHSTRSFYEPQYYKVEHQDPLSLFGYILVLEGLGIVRGRWIAERVETAFGKACATFVKVHAEDDPDHLDKAFKILEGVNQAQQDRIELNMHQTTFSYLALLAEIQRSRKS